MRILACNPGHDGVAVLLEKGRLSYALENEKDDGYRHSMMSPTLFLRSLQDTDIPDVVAISGYLKAWFGERPVDSATAALARVEAGYFEEGPDGKTESEIIFASKNVRRFSSSHVRSHLLCSYGLSPFPQGQPCYALIWEGTVGALYYIDEDVSIRKIGDVLTAPGIKYSVLYVLGDPAFPMGGRAWVRHEDAGKLMALAAYGRRGAPTAEQKKMIDSLLSLDVFGVLSTGPTPKAIFRSSGFCNVGVETHIFKDLAWQYSAALFDHFHRFAKEHVTQKLPLIIAGGCGLNCDWNSQWRSCGLFMDVFVPPCTNDSGVALGAAIDALHHYTGQAKIEWSVYAGESFMEDVDGSSEFDSVPLDISDVCRRLLKGDVIA